jgi:hypothetical protein
MHARSFTKLIFVGEVGAKLRRPVDAPEDVPVVVDCLDGRPGLGPRGVAEDSRLLLAGTIVWRHTVTAALRPAVSAASVVSSEASASGLSAAAASPAAASSERPRERDAD